MAVTGGVWVSASARISSVRSVDRTTSCHDNARSRRSRGVGTVGSLVETPYSGDHVGHQRRKQIAARAQSHRASIRGPHGSLGEAGRERAPHRFSAHREPRARIAHQIRQDLSSNPITRGPPSNPTFSRWLRRASTTGLQLQQAWERVADDCRPIRPSTVSVTPSSVLSLVARLVARIAAVATPPQLGTCVG